MSKTQSDQLTTEGTSNPILTIFSREFEEKKVYILNICHNLIIYSLNQIKTYKPGCSYSFNTWQQANELNSVSDRFFMTCLILISGKYTIIYQEKQRVAI